METKFISNSDNISFNRGAIKSQTDIITTRAKNRNNYQLIHFNIVINYYNIKQ
jgi:hypothetical protein